MIAVIIVFIICLLIGFIVYIAYRSKCKHSWKLDQQASYETHNRFTNVKQEYTEYIYICSKCGEFKKEKL